MKFSKELIATLKNFSTINSGIFLQKGDFIMTRSVNGATYGEAVLDGVELEFDVAIYDLNGFLGILSLSGEDSEVTVKGSDIIIKGKRSEIIWPSAEPASIVYPKKAIQFPPALLEFDLSGEDYSQLIRISRAVGADTLAITSEGDNVVINSYNKTVDSNLKKALSTFVVAKNTTNTEFNFIINMTNMKLQTGDYQVKLWAKDHMCAAKFVGAQASYVIAVEADSTHNF